MTSLYSMELFGSGTVCTVMSALGIFTQCLGRGIPENRNDYYHSTLIQCLSKWKQKTITYLCRVDRVRLSIKVLEVVACGGGV